MNVISFSSLGLSYSDLQRDVQRVMKSQETTPQKPRTEKPSEQPQTERRSTFGTSLYDAYGLEKGFSKKSDTGDSVEISRLAQMLYQAEQNREVWNSGSGGLRVETFLEKDGTISRKVDLEYWESRESHLLQGEVDFNGLFKEAISDDGGTIFRRINPEYLDQITTVEEALYLYEKFHESVEGKMVMTLSQDAAAISLRLSSLAHQDWLNAVTDLVDNTSALYDRHQDFKEALVKQHPSLAGVSFEFGLDGDKFKVLNPSFGSRASLSIDQIKLIEDFANSNDKTSKRLLEVMYEIREASVNFYNMWSEPGRSNPIDASDFDKRFGGFNSYLESFHSAGSARGKSGPDDPTTYRAAYFNNATDYAVSRLAY